MLTSKYNALTKFISINNWFKYNFTWDVKREKSITYIHMLNSIVKNEFNPEVFY